MAYNDYSSKGINRVYNHPFIQGLFPVKQRSVQQHRQWGRMERIHSSPISSLFSHCFLLHKGSSVRRDGVWQGRGDEQGGRLGVLWVQCWIALVAKHLTYQ